MTECPLCEEKCEGWQALAEHLVRWHGSRGPNWATARRLRRPLEGYLVVYRKKHKVRCWCGEVFSLLRERDDALFTDVGISDFASHLYGVGDVAAHVVACALGVNDA